MRFVALLLVVGCAAPPPSDVDSGSPMPATYTASADAIISGGAVQISEPVDTDALTAASNNIPEEKLADIVKKLVNQAVLGGLTPSVLDTNLTGGLLFASEATAGGARVRMYCQTAAGVRHFQITLNAAYNSGLGSWSADDAAQPSYGFIVFGAAMQFGMKAAGAAPWLTWDLTDLTASAGTGSIATQTPIAMTGSYLGAWQDIATVNYEGGHYWKDPMGRTRADGVIRSGTTATNAFQLPVPYRPLKNRVFIVAAGSAAGATWPRTAAVLVDTLGFITPFFTNAGDDICLDGINF